MPAPGALCPGIRETRPAQGSSPAVVGTGAQAPRLVQSSARPRRHGTLHIDSSAAILVREAASMSFHGHPSVLGKKGSGFPRWCLENFQFSRLPSNRCN